MRVIVIIIILSIRASAAFAGSVADCTGLVRAFGDMTSWMSSSLVIGDGSWVVAPADAVTEKVGPKTDQTVRYPIFISSYTGLAYQCELSSVDKDLGIALLKLPVSGLPAVTIGQFAEFNKCALGTMGQLTGDDLMGNRWPTDIYGIVREKSDKTYRLVLGEWGAKQGFVTDIDNYKWLFLSQVSPDTPIPSGAAVMRDTTVVGMYLNKLRITGGKVDLVYGRTAMSSEIARYLSNHSLHTAELYSPPAPTANHPDDADSVFQLQGRLYSLIGARTPGQAVEPATALAKMRPEDAQAQLALGVALTGAGKFEDALKAFDAAAKLDPKLPTLLTNRALVLMGLGKKAEAEAELLQAVRDAPGDPRPVTAIADFYLSDEKTFDKALSYAQQAATLSPNSPATLLLVARVQKRQKNYEAAASTIADAVKMAPDWSEAWYALGSTYEAAGDVDNAEKAYIKLVAKQPTNPAFLLTLASFYVDHGKNDDAADEIARLRALNPPQPVLDAAKALEDKMAGKAAK